MNYKTLIKELDRIFEIIQNDELTLLDLIYYEDRIVDIFDELQECKEKIIRERI